MPLYNLIPVSSDSVEGLLKPNTIFVGNYQTDFNDLNGHAYTSVGSPLISTDKSPFSGGSSLYLPGSSYLQYTANSDFQLNADWKMECFVWIPSSYATNNTYGSFICLQGGGIGSLNFGIMRSGYNNNGIYKQLYAQIYVPVQSIDLTCYSINSAQFDTWNHLAFIRNGNALYFFVNNICQSVLSVATQFKFTSDPTILIGYANGSPALTGAYIAGARIKSTSVEVHAFPFTE